MSAPYDYVLVAREGDVATVTVNRPDKRNALSAKVIAELTHAFHHLRFAKGEDAVRAVILTGAGDRAFVAGADIAAMSAMTSPEAYAFSEAGHRLGYQIEMAPFAVLAAVNGFALGGGCELMLACDLAYASESAQLGQPEVSLGVIPGFGDQREVELLVDAGFKPEEAIKIATLNGASYLGLADRIGSVAPGKNADLVVVKGDPSKTTADIENVEIVFKDGVGYDAPKLLESVKGRYGQY